MGKRDTGDRTVTGICYAIFRHARRCDPNEEPHALARTCGSVRGARGNPGPYRDPAAYTSQRCHACGHTEKDSRKTQEEFECVACGYADNADYNASANILASGIGAAARGGACSLEPPMSREMDMLRAA